MTLLGYLKLSISCSTVRKAMISGDIWVSSGISRYDNGIRETFFPLCSAVTAYCICANYKKYKV